MSHAKTVHFHVGAHKTATTYIQSRLRSNKEGLRDAGIDFIDLWARSNDEAAYRKTLKAAIEGDSVDESRVSSAADQLRSLVAERASPANSLVVMSFENVLGDFDLSKQGAPYPHAEAAIRHIAEAFSDCDLKIFFSFRSLDRFVESGYVQLVCTRLETRRFKDYVDQIDARRMTWTTVMQVIGSVAGADNTLAWAYEDFLTNERPVWDALLDRPDAQSLLVRPAKKTNYSLSGKGLKYMRNINKIATAADARKFRPFVRQHFSTSTGLKAPKLLDDDRRRILVANYARNRDELGAGCRLLIQAPPR